MSPEEEMQFLLDRVREGKPLSRRQRRDVETWLLVQCAEELEHICTKLGDREGRLVEQNGVHQ